MDNKIMSNSDIIRVITEYNNPVSYDTDKDGGAGLSIEKILGKKPDTKPTEDFDRIAEVKSTVVDNKSPITLFSIDSCLNIKKIIEEVKSTSKNGEGCSLYTSLSVENKGIEIEGDTLKLKLDKDGQKSEIDEVNKETIKEFFEKKLSYNLDVVRYSPYKELGLLVIHSIEVFDKGDFNEFWQAILDSKVIFDFRINSQGKSHGSSFKIKEQFLSEVFPLIEIKSNPNYMELTSKLEGNSYVENYIVNSIPEVFNESEVSESIEFSDEIISDFSEHMGFDEIRAFAELTDNSHDAGATKVFINHTPVKEGILVTVTDNGRGMNKEGLLRMTNFGTSVSSSSYGREDASGTHGVGFSVSLPFLGKTGSIATITTSDGKGYAYTICVKVGRSKRSNEVKVTPYSGDSFTKISFLSKNDFLMSTEERTYLSESLSAEYRQNADGSDVLSIIVDGMYTPNRNPYIGFKEYNDYGDFYPNGNKNRNCFCRIKLYKLDESIDIDKNLLHPIDRKYGLTSNSGVYFCGARGKFYTRGNNFDEIFKRKGWSSCNEIRIDIEASKECATFCSDMNKKFNVNNFRSNKWFVSALNKIANDIEKLYNLEKRITGIEKAIYECMLNKNCSREVVCSYEIPKNLEKEFEKKITYFDYNTKVLYIDKDESHMKKFCKIKANPTNVASTIVSMIRVYEISKGRYDLNSLLDSLYT